MNIIDELPRLLPLAISWAVEEEAKALKNEVTLSPLGVDLAKAVGVAHPSKVRVVVAETLPYPDNPLLRKAAEQLGMFGPGMVGLTLGYAVFMIKGREDVLAHELRHVYQYEVAGSIAEFLPVYLRQVAEFGYHNAPLEQDARDYERTRP